MPRSRAARLLTCALRRGCWGLGIPIDGHTCRVKSSPHKALVY